MISEGGQKHRGVYCLKATLCILSGIKEKAEGGCTHRGCLDSYWLRSMGFLLGVNLPPSLCSLQATSLYFPPYKRTVMMHLVGEKSRAALGDASFLFHISCSQTNRPVSKRIQGHTKYSVHWYGNNTAEIHLEC